MNDCHQTAPTTGWQWAVRAIALVAVVFYAATAHQTKGHEADFGKQWLAARLVATGQGARLYDPVVQRRELERHYSMAVIEHGIWREGIGGPTYPPTFAIAAAPLGLLSPRAAQWIVVEISILLVIVSAVQLSRLVHGRVSAEAAVAATLCYPSFLLAMGLGQNTAWSLFLCVTGWCMLRRGHDLAAGLVWGLFAIKPTWGIAIAWVPLVVARPRAYLGMAISAAVLVLSTLPWCGVSSWFDWLDVARQTEIYYQALPRWTLLSRDLPGLVRRFCPDADVEFAGWAMLAAVVAATAATWRFESQAAGGEGPRSVAVLAAIVLTCPRFMFYDMTLAVVAYIVAFSDWRQIRPGSRLCLVALAAAMWAGTAFSYTRWAMLGPPLDTCAVVALWCWSIHEAWIRSVARRRRYSTMQLSPIAGISKPVS